MALQLGQQQDRLLIKKTIDFPGDSLEEVETKEQAVKELLKYLDVDSWKILAKKASIPNVNKKVKTYVKLLS